MLDNLKNLPTNALELVETYLLSLQQNIIDNLLSIESLHNGATTFHKDEWVRENGGGGITQILEGGKVFAKAGVNFSHINGNKLPGSSTMLRKDLTNCKFHALGVSVVIHPDNPYVPTTHANVRFFVAMPENALPIWWFGGGFDLTPYYGFEEDCTFWHEKAKKACDPFGDNLYARLKKWCDEYFYLPHRNEARGIGGIFFDDFNEKDFEHSFNFLQSVGNNFIEAYVPIVKNRKDISFGEREKQFQLYRRGRYVEFNLIYDRGTIFGLNSNGRTESIFVSLPPEVNWTYNFTPEKNTLEEKLYTDFLPPKNWLQNL